MISDKKEQLRLYQNFGPSALVTGATSGIGLEVTGLLLEAGFEVLAVGRNTEQLCKRYDSFEATGKLFIRKADLKNGDEVQSVVAEARQRKVSLLVLSAGFGTSGYFHENRFQDEQGMLKVNCEAVLEITHGVLPDLIKNRRGGIVFLSSIVAFQGAPFSSHYAATKAYIQTLAEGLSYELQPKGISVLSAAPGPVISGFAERAAMTMSTKLTPEEVALGILKSLGRKSQCYPGFSSKFLHYSLQLLPRRLRVHVMKQIMKGMSNAL